MYSSGVIITCSCTY